MVDLPEEHTGSVVKKFWEKFAAAFADPLSANGALSDFVSNTNITGAYAEAWVRAMVRSMLPGFRVSTGAVIGASDSSADLSELPQLDLIVWDPSELPALFEKDDFALVHRQAARAIIEVKRSISSKNECREQMRKQQHRLLSDHLCNVLCVVVSHSTPLIEVKVHPDWPAQRPLHSEPEFTRLLDMIPNHKPIPMAYLLLYIFSLMWLGTLGSPTLPT